MAKRSTIEPLKEGEKISIDKSSLKKLAGIFNYMMPYKVLFIAGLVSLVLSNFTILAFPKLAGELLDVASGTSKYFSSINQVTIALIVVLFTQSIFSFIRVYTFAIVIEKGMANVRKSVYQKIIWLPMRFFDSRRVGELMSRLTSDVSTLQETFSFTLAELLRQILSLVFGTVIIFFLAPTLTAFMLFTFPILVVAALIFGKYIRRLSRKSQDKLAESNVIVEESLQSILVVKAFTNEVFEINRYTRALKEVVSVATQSAKYRSLFISFVIFVIFGGIVSIGWYGAKLVQTHAITTGELFSFVIYTSLIGFSIGGLGDIYTQLQRAVGASERVLDILNEGDESEIAVETAKKLSGQIEFKNVSFYYPSRVDFKILNNLNFKIEAGEKIALVGPSGSGKSTIINLLMRFYAASKGEIRVDGKSVTDYNLSSYRQNIGIVPQEVILFGGTIYENISYGNPEASVEQIKEAAKKANALEFIESFPEKFQTIVGDRGVKLSGGQRQRIAIARAVLKDPSILVLDEATSSLDAGSEVLVQEALEKLMVGRTSIIIAHRLSTIKNADRILVIKDGMLAEVGSHSELIQLNDGVYGNLLKLQLE